MKGKISDDEKRIISDKCKETIPWLETNLLRDYTYKQKELENVCHFIVTKMYQGSMPGGMPSSSCGAQARQGSRSGPTIEGKHRVTKRGPALSNPMFTRGPRHRWSLESCLCDSSPATTLRFTYAHGQVVSLVVIVGRWDSP
ncbi:unnamed protein product [Ranitomeya imitator]|uniref:Uncharacterized protein n=1 Tax=Ranitomeya imitator TaxID=111125 RepID=A0ABN9LY39_9NEOB|nr:unnamed protein product [Ranitomeya imitator]